jgi:hypothetical protein
VLGLETWEKKYHSFFVCFFIITLIVVEILIINKSLLKKFPFEFDLSLI